MLFLPPSPRPATTLTTVPLTEEPGRLDWIKPTSVNIPEITETALTLAAIEAMIVGISMIVP